MTNTVCNVHGLGQHAGRHKAHKIGLNLEVQVVGVGVVEPVAAFRGHDALTDVVSAGLISVSKVIGGVCKAKRKLL